MDRRIAILDACRVKKYNCESNGIGKANIANMTNKAPADQQDTKFV